MRVTIEEVWAAACAIEARINRDKGGQKLLAAKTGRERDINLIAMALTHFHQSLED